MKNFRLSFLAVLLFAAFAAQPLVAQNTKQPATKSTKAAQNSTAVADHQTPYCDEILPKVVEQLQAKAETSCKTVTTCVLCLDRTVDAELYMTMFAQPNSQRCKRAAVDIAYQLPKGKKAPDFNFEIVQSVCTKSGVNLELSFPDGSIEPANYTYVWEVDGKPAGTKLQLSCVCGKTASVTVTEKASKRRVVKTMRLQDACNTSTD